MSALFGGGEQKVPKPPDPNKAAQEAAEQNRKKRLSAAGFRSTILTNFMPENSPALKQYLGS